VRKEDDYSALFVTVSPNPVAGDSVAKVIVQLIDSNDKPLRETTVGDDDTAEFLYLKPGKYYMRAYIDRNGNGQWDTGRYDDDLQAEPVYYYNEELECKEKWDVNRTWNLTATPRYRQKPVAIIKQKPDKEKQLKNRNIERAKQLGKQYLKEAGIPQ